MFADGNVRGGKPGCMVTHHFVRLFYARPCRNSVRCLFELTKSCFPTRQSAGAMVATRSTTAAMHASGQQDASRKASGSKPDAEAMDLGASGDALGEQKELELYGVVEGFYGRPWSWGQRRKLFHMLRDFGLNCYMYAPKDDLKHRAYWKTMYTPEECTLLRRMIEDAVSAGIVFVYALSPGVDITYSNREDIETMRRKLTQIVQLGCTAFALLFDDLDPPQLRDIDAKKFKNFAEAQCTVANLMYEHLGKPQNFLFCPTEYCATRAVPNVRESEYLRTCGRMLPKPIHILWTGPNVISRFLTAEGLTELEKVIDRKCTIWDNLHANDYDRQRIYLGPYDRDPQEVVPHVRGILLNPNCEFGANHLPIHTFHTWYHSQDSQHHLRHPGGPHPSTFFSSVPPPPYALTDAVDSAIAWWTGEWNVPQDAYGNALGNNLSSEQMPSPPLSNIPMIDAASSSDDQEMRSSSAEPGRNNNTSIDSTSTTGAAANAQQLPAGSLVQIDDIRVLVDLFYLPFQYGQIASELVEDFRWLRLNAAMRRRLHSQQQEQARHHQLSGNAQQQSTPLPPALPVEWEQRMQRFESHYARVNRMCKNLARCANRALLHELYPYFWDLNHLLSIIRSYLKWLMTATQDDAAGAAGSGDSNSSNAENSVSGNNSSQWPSQATRNEPWYNRGGLFGEFQRLLPLDVRSSDLFSCAPADPHTEKIYSIRPYFESTDRVAIFELCAAALRPYDAALQLVAQLDMPINASNTVDAAIYERSASPSTSVLTNSASASSLAMLPSTLSNKWHHHRHRHPSSPPVSMLTVGEALVSNSVIGAYLNMSPSRLICFVNCSEQSAFTGAFSNENEMICGYVMAAPEARAFRTNAKPWFQITASQYTRALQGVPVDLSGKGGTAATNPSAFDRHNSDMLTTSASTDIAEPDTKYGTKDMNTNHAVSSFVAQNLAQTFEILCCGPEQQGFPAELYQQYPSIMTLSVSDDDVSASNALKRLLTCALAALKSKGSTGVHAVLNQYNMHLKAVYQRYNFIELERRRVDIHKPSKRFADELRRSSTNTGSLSAELNADGQGLTEVESTELLVLGRSI